MSQKILDINGKLPAPSNKGKTNAYICPELHVTVTIDLDEGLTPPYIGCPDCKQPAQSRMYQVNQSFEPVFEWYKPPAFEIMNLKAKYDVPTYNRLVEHVRKGGLISRPYTKPKVEEVKDGE